MHDPRNQGRLLQLLPRGSRPHHLGIESPPAIPRGNCCHFFRHKWAAHYYHNRVAGHIDTRFFHKFLVWLARRRKLPTEGTSGYENSASPTRVAPTYHFQSNTPETSAAVPASHSSTLFPGTGRQAMEPRQKRAVARSQKVPGHCVLRTSYLIVSGFCLSGAP